MTQQMGIRELRDTLTRTMRRVRDGETFEITRDSTPVAVLSRSLRIELPASWHRVMLTVGDCCRSHWHAFRWLGR